MGLSMDNLFVALLWILWCILHSALITRTVTDYMKQKLGYQYRFYRLFFNTVSLVTLAPLLYYSAPYKGPLVAQWEGSLLIVKYLLLMTGVFLFVAGARHYSMSQFIGIHQIKTGRTDHTLSEFDTFDTSGILSVIRHPWYTGGILIIWSSDIYLSSLLNNIVISVYFIIGAFLEERKLLLEFGDKYREYRQGVSMFVPYKWLKTKVTGLTRTRMD
jgi:protein-S-isoprenylcysteine O-methyltransferase Ste14